MVMIDPSLLVSFLFVAIGMHLPKAFTLYYISLAILLVLEFKTSVPNSLVLRTCLLLVCFGFSYAAISLYHGLSLFHGRDLIDLISIIVLPALGVWVGYKSAVGNIGWRGIGWFSLAYGIGALLYALVALMHGRVWVEGGDLASIWQLRRMSSISIPWGSELSMNVRSVEQNAAISLAWFFPSLWLMRLRVNQSLGMSMFLASVLAAVVVFCFNGRLGYLTALVGCVPILYLSKLSGRIIRRAALSALCLFTSIIIVVRSSPLFSSVFITRLYDERFDRFAAFFLDAYKFPFGGNQIHFEAYDQARKVLMNFDARQGDLMHNVVMDIYVRVGLIPTLLLLSAVVPIIFRWLKVMATTRSYPEVDPSLLLINLFLLCIGVQWLFQPLVYGDGLLFYFGFMVLGSMAGRPDELNA